MSPQQFLAKVRAFPRDELQHAKAVVLAAGPPPRSSHELDRFYFLVWLRLNGALQEPSPQVRTVGR
jgi:hypothetical protein